jgi:hypothetical protein
MPNIYWITFAVGFPCGNTMLPAGTLDAPLVANNFHEADHKASEMLRCGVIGNPGHYLTEVISIGTGIAIRATT